MSYQSVQDQLCEEGQRLLDAWMPVAFTPDEDQANIAYAQHKWNCLTCIRVTRQVAFYMGGNYLKDVDARIEELQMQVAVS